MNRELQNQNIPTYFSEWAVKNLEMTNDTRAIAATCDKNIEANADHEDIQEIKRLFKTFQSELGNHRHGVLLDHYRSLIANPIAV